MAALYGSGAIGGVINLITRRGQRARPALHRRPVGRLPAQILGNGAVTGVNGPFDYAAIYEGQSQRGFDVTPKRESIYTGVPDGFRAQVGTLNLGYTPVEGTRLSLLLRGRTTTFGFNALGSPTFDNANSTGHTDSLLGRVGVTSSCSAAGTRPGCLGACRMTGTTPNRSIRAIRTRRPTTRVITPTGPTCNGTTPCISTISSGSPRCPATELTFGYEYIADSAKVRVASSSFGFPSRRAPTRRWRPTRGIPVCKARYGTG